MANSNPEPKWTVLSVVGTRPNFMKVGPIDEAFKPHPEVRHILLHTGQHYDDNMSKVFFEDLGIRKPDIHLDIQGGNLGDQTGRIMVAFEQALLEINPDLVVVVGDVNSTFAAAWVAIQNHIAVAHVESGLRSFDRKMPEEINRLCTDVICDLLFTTHDSADLQLKKEGIAAEKIFMVGDIMIDYLVKLKDKAEALARWQDFGVTPGKYGVVTLHRPSNVDRPETLKPLVEVLTTIAAKMPLVFAVHPRTQKNLDQFGLATALSNQPNLHTTKPLGYLEFLSLVSQSGLVLTDSGGLQEETTFLNIPCMTLRENTERPFCVDHGTNYLVGTKPENILATFEEILAGNRKHSQNIEGWGR